jgi:hypothetical protein
MTEKMFNSGIRHKSWEDKKRFTRNVLSRCNSISILAKAIAERPEDVFSTNITEVCAEVQEKYNMKNSPNINLYL